MEILGVFLKICNDEHEMEKPNLSEISALPEANCSSAAAEPTLLSVFVIKLLWS